MCILSVLVIILLCPWHRGCPLLKSNPIFSIELVVPITWMGYSYHLDGLFPTLREMGAVVLFWSAHFMESTVS